MGGSSATSHRWPKPTSRWRTKRQPNPLLSAMSARSYSARLGALVAPGRFALNGALDQLYEAGAVDEVKVVALGKLAGLLAELPRGQHHGSLDAGAAHVAVELRQGPVVDLPDPPLLAVDEGLLTVLGENQVDRTLS